MFPHPYQGPSPIDTDEVPVWLLLVRRIHGLRKELHVPLEYVPPIDYSNLLTSFTGENDDPNDIGFGVSHIVCVSGSQILTR